MLIIEGSDNLGKTILAKKIVDKMMEKGFPTVYSHMGRPNEQLFDFFYAYKDIMNSCSVMDRFHLGGLAYHHDKITPQRLTIINSWVRSVGGLIVVLYAGDQEWYRERIENDERGNLLDIDTMCKGNAFFKQYHSTGGRDSDYAFNIMPHGFSKINFVSDYDVDELVDEWAIRRRELGIGDI